MQKIDPLEYHKSKKGKIEVSIKVKCDTVEELSAAYTPGVAVPCIEINKDPDKVYEYTIKGNSVAVVTDGSAVLGLGNIGAKAALPVMEGKALLFKKFANIDAYPICIETQDPSEIINIVKNISPGFGGINLEDISAPRCFEIEETLIKELDIPVFHDDQHGTAVVTLAGLINALKIAQKKIEECKIVMSGAGAAAISIAKLLITYGAKKENIFMFDRKGLLSSKREDLNKYKAQFVQDSELTMAEALVDADIFIGVSSKGVLNGELVKRMSKTPIIFAMANPDPEILPDEVYKVRNDAIVATGRSDYPNQVNNVLGFPGIFRGALDVRARVINDEMKLAASFALASLVSAEDLENKKIIPSPFNPEVVPSVSKAVAEAAIKTNVAKISY